MKLYRFSASTTQKAILTVNEALGPNALVYSTRKIANGVEVLAGLPFDNNEIVTEVFDGEAVRIEPVNKEINIHDTLFDHKVIEHLKEQIETMSETVQHLSNSITSLQHAFIKKFSSNKLLEIVRLLKRIDFRQLLKIRVSIQRREPINRE